MKKALCALLSSLLLLSLTTACGSQTAPPASSSLPDSAPESKEIVTFTDSLGREVTVERPERVATLIGSFADIWCLAGGKDALVATANDTWTQFDLGLDESVANLGGVKDTNMEALLAAEPDLVIASSNTGANVDLLPTLEQAGIPVVYFMVSNFDEYLHMLDICTQLTGKPEQYEQYGSAISAQVERARVQADGSAPTVLYVRATGSSCKVKNSENSVLGEMLADLGCVNIADSETSLLENLSMEAIVAADPDYIFAVLQGADPTDAEQMLQDTLLSNPAWSGLTAVCEGRFHTMDPNLYNLKPNARWGEAYEKLADIVYPET